MRYSIPGVHLGPFIARLTERSVLHVVRGNIVWTRERSELVNRKIFVQGLPGSVDDAILAHAFSEVGQVISAEVKRNLKTGLSRGFGFVEMSTAQEPRNPFFEFVGIKLG
jgi:hypothetical protein